eukprot:COSAG01_NODE_5332_length_4329_cov_4505.447991_2_plen_52_part_00
MGERLKAAGAKVRAQAGIVATSAAWHWHSAGGRLAGAYVPMQSMAVLSRGA